MQADVERFSFDPKKRFLRVIEQQGRVALAADTNEQAAILLEGSRRLAADVIGPFGTPADENNDAPGPGFQIDVAQGNALIRGGVYWVDGLRCVNDEDTVAYSSQADYPDAPALADGAHVLYLDAWERHVVAAQDPSIRDVALGGPDTASRSALVWQVKAHPIDTPAALPDFDEVHGRRPAAALPLDGQWARWFAEIEPADRGLLAVEAMPASVPPDPCGAAPGSGYVGNENQHYRVEIHRGSAPTGEAGEPPPPPTFKWSRDNGSVVYPVHAVDGAIATLVDPPIDCRKQLVPGSLVELVDDRTSLLNEPGHLARVVDVDDDGDDVLVQLDPPPLAGFDATRHPMLRRWDHVHVPGGDGFPREADDRALTVVEGDDEWVTLEDGIRIRFAGLVEGVERRYRTGDYWTFPARAAIGDVIWPETDGVPHALAPHGIDHAYAPLAVVRTAGGGVAEPPVDVRWGFARLATLRPRPSNW